MISVVTTLYHHLYPAVPALVESGAVYFASFLLVGTVHRLVFVVIFFLPSVVSCVYSARAYISTHVSISLLTSAFYCAAACLSRAFCWFVGTVPCVDNRVLHVRSSDVFRAVGLHRGQSRGGLHLLLRQD